MSFYASNDRIYITDTNGAVVFDTNKDIPHILSVVEANISKVFYEQYYTEEYFTLATLPSDADFIICRATCVPVNLEGVIYNPADIPGSGMTGGARGYGAYEWMVQTRNSSNGNEVIDWSVLTPNGSAFFQGSLPLEMGQQMVWQGGGYSVAQYARRVLHVYVEPDWGNKLVAMFQQSVKSGYGAVTTLIPAGPVGGPGNTGDVWSTSASGQNYYSRRWDGGGVGFPQGRWPQTRYGIPVQVNHLYDDWTGSWVDRFYSRPNPMFGPGAVRWEIKLKVWAGKFRA